MFHPTTHLKAALAALLLATTSGTLIGQGTPMTSNVPKAEQERQLIATLQSPASAMHDKVVACHRLAIIGTKEAVPALAAMLTDEKMAHYARYALEPMPDPSAAAALRAALGQLQGQLLVGVINSIGFRRDGQATAALARLLTGTDDQVTAAAAAALGRIGSTAAAQELQQALARTSGALQIACADSSLTCAEALVVNRQAGEAAAIYDRLCAPSFPDYIRTAAMYGAITARAADGIPLLLAQLNGQDEATLAAAWRAARVLPGSKVTQALAAAMDKVPAAKQVRLIQVLGDRGDKAALPAVLKATKNNSAPVRLAAIQLLPKVDDGSSGPATVLLSLSAGSDRTEADTALASLGQIGATGTNAMILAALPSAAPALRAKFIGVLGARRAEGASGELLKQAASPDAEVSKAAFRALAVIARPADLPELIRLSTASRDDAVKVPADLAVYAVSMKIEPATERAAPVLTALRAATTAQTRCSLLRPLGAIVKANGGSPQAFATIKTALDDRDPAVRDAALRCLTDWPDATPAALLLDIIKRDPAHRELAMRGGVRMAADVAAGRDPAKLDFLAWFTQANQAVTTREEKLIIVSGLGNVKQIEALKMLQPYLDDPTVQTEAALAVFAIAPELAKAGHAGMVKNMLDQITKTTQDADVKRTAGKMAKSLQPSAKKGKAR